MGVFQQNSTLKFYFYSSTHLIVVIMASLKKDGVTFDELTSTSLDNYIGSLSSRGNYIDMCYMGRIPLGTHLSIIFLWMLVGSSFLSEPLVVVVTLNFFGVGFVGLCLSFILQKNLNLEVSISSLCFEIQELVSFGLKTRFNSI
jgi:hypothetical protein